ncbi:MAG: hypothetical protein HKN09_09325 [Saprospiraceae bacterium]|nr:hypothetical protein [Saprospiraceae bacterium]
MTRKKSKKYGKKKAAEKSSNDHSDVKKLAPSQSIEGKSLLIWRTLILMGFIALAFILYGKGLQFGYVLDDKIVITDNSYTKKGFDGVWDLLTTESFEGYFGEQKNLLEGGRYRPLSLVTFAIEHEFFGLNSTVSHVINVLLYGLCAFLAFITLQRLLQEKTKRSKILLSLSFLTALVFLVHPLHTEAVANIKGRDEILAFLFSISTLLFGLKYYDTKKLAYIPAMLICYFLGLLAKENTITFLAIIPFGIVLFRKKAIRNAIRIALYLLGITFIYLVIRYQVIGFLLNGGNTSTDLMNNPFLGMRSIERFSTVMYTLIIYLKLHVVPNQLTHDYYPYHIPIMQLQNIWVILSILIHLAMAGLVFYFWKKKPVIAFALGFYLAAMSIVSNLIVDVGTFMNERFAFTASLGICLLMVYLLQKVADKLPFRQHLVLPSLIAILVIPYSLKTFDRVPAWESALTLNTAAIKVSKNSARANSFMATALFEEYKITTDRATKQALLDKAQPYMLKAVEIHPNYYNGNLMRAGIAAEQYKMNGDLDALLSEFMQVIAIRPDIGYLTEYLKYLNDRADINTMTQFYINASRMILNQNKNLSWSVHYALLGNQINPQNQELRNLLVQGYTRIGRPQDAAKFQ